MITEHYRKQLIMLLTETHNRREAILLQNQITTACMNQLQVLKSLILSIEDTLNITDEDKELSYEKCTVPAIKDHE